MQQRIAVLIKVVSDSDKMELVMLNNALVAATNNSKKDPSPGNVKEWRKLKADMMDLLDILESKYEISNSDTVIFRTKKSVLEYLLGNGWKISQSQFYDHCKIGLLRPAKGGGYPLKAVVKYAELHVKRADTGEKEAEWETKIREEKLTISLDRERVGLEREQFDLDARRGKYIPRAEFELAIVSRAVAFMAHLNHTVQESVPSWIDLVGGDQGKAPQLVEAISRKIEQRMGDFAAEDEIEVILEATA